MPTARVNNLSIEYETFGKPEDRPLVLIMGLGSQLVSWPVEFCRQLASKGHFVVRFDNRDVGLSTKCEDAGVPDFRKIGEALSLGKRFAAPYHLSDMAKDAVGLMDALDLKKAHVCGLSMGGMIAQSMAIIYPERLFSLISMESSTGAPDLPKARPGIHEALLKPAPLQRTAYIRHMCELHAKFAGGSNKYDRNVQEKISALAHDRGLCPNGVARQYAAILASGSRRKALSSVDLPALVIHGDMDTLLPWEHGQDTAEAIDGAELLIINGLGHGTAYPDLWGQIIEAIATHTAKSDG